MKAVTVQTVTCTTVTLKTRKSNTSILKTKKLETKRFIFIKMNVTADQKLQVN